jgi:glycosyltransferase involved in cell wall biosynthesis
MRLLSAVIGVNVKNCVIIIPAFNAAATIAETLIALQDCPKLNEIDSVIILDDFSTDGTSSIAQAVWRCDTPMAIWPNESNIGERRTVNRAFEKLGGDTKWTLILHADDVVKPNWLSLYFEAIENINENTATICSSYDNWWSDTGQIDPGQDEVNDSVRVIPGDLDSLRGTMDRGCWWHISGCAIRNSAFGTIGPFISDMPQLGDWEWLLRCHAKGFDIGYIPRTTMLYRQHSRSISSNSFREGRDLIERLRIFKMMLIQGHLNRSSYMKKMLILFAQASRRMGARLLRKDWRGVQSHLRVLTLAGKDMLSSSRNIHVSKVAGARSD